MCHSTSTSIILHTHARESQGHWCMTQRRKCECRVSPCGETVRGGDDPAGRDERGAAEEALALLKYSGEPRVRLDNCEGAAHDFVRPSLGCLTAGQLCKDAIQWVATDSEWKFKREEKKKEFCYGGNSKTHLCPPHVVSPTRWGLSNGNKPGH